MIGNCSCRLRRQEASPRPHETSGAESFNKGRRSGSAAPSDKLDDAACRDPPCRAARNHHPGGPDGRETQAGEHLHVQCFGDMSVSRGQRVRRKFFAPVKCPRDEGAT